MTGRFRLHSLQVSGFRGAREKITVPLDKPLNIIAGENGSGKSTLVTAIEWALFPKEATTLADHEIDERRSWEVKHVHGDQQPSVELTLSSDGGQTCIRQQGVKAGKGKSAIRCGYQDFKSLTHVHQETLRDFLVGTPKPREEMFQRLLGAGWAQDLKGALEQAGKKLNCTGADQRVNQLDQLLNARMSEAHRLLEQAEADARSVGLARPWDQAGETQVQIVNSSIEAVCSELGIPAPAVPLAEPLRSFSSRLTPVLQELRGLGPTSKHTQLSDRKLRLETARQAYSTADGGVKAAEQDLRKAREQAGGEAEVAGQLGGLAQEQQQVERDLESLSKERALLGKALDYLESQPEANQCPVCLQLIPRTELVVALRRRVETALSQQERTLRTRLGEIGEQAGRLRKAQELLQNLSAQRELAVRRLGEQRNKLEEVLGRAVREHEDPLAVADAEIQAVKAELDVIARAVEDFHRRLNAVQTEAQKVDRVGQIGQHQERVDKLGETRDTPEWQAMLAAQRALSQREQFLKHASTIAGELAAELARQNLDQARATITDLYHKLTRRTDFPEVRINPDQKYEITVQREKSTQAVTAVLNTTDLNAVAIAVIAGMAVTFPEVHDLDFLILDDPSQGMDPEVAQRLGEVISELSEKIQVVVTTPDPDLLGALERSPRLKNVIRLKPRDPASAVPCVRLESVV
ncbi:MAG: AAA family ATPase [Planctomycetota bacterium]